MRFQLQLLSFAFFFSTSLLAQGDCRRYLDLSCQTCGQYSSICSQVKDAIESCADGICREATCGLLANHYLMYSQIDEINTLCLLSPGRLVEKQARDREFSSNDHSLIVQSLACLDQARSKLDQALKNSVEFEFYVLNYGTNITPQLARKLRGSKSRLSMGYRNYRKAIQHVSHTQFNHALRQCENSEHFALQVNQLTTR